VPPVARDSRYPDLSEYARYPQSKLEPGRGYNNSLVVMLRCIPVIFPYLISVAFSRRRVTAARAGPWVFALILVAGTGATGYFYLTRYEQTAIDTLSAILLQTSVYVLAAILLLRRDP
jgi:hypothetical protein